MIRLTRDSANDVVVTLTEKGTAAHYLFEFYSETANSGFYCVQQDTSAHPERYNKFVITDTSGAVAADGEVDLPINGEYKYTIYANSSSSNVDPSGLTELETGMMTMTGTVTATDTYEPTPPTIAAYEA